MNHVVFGIVLRTVRLAFSTTCVPFGDGGLDFDLTTTVHQKCAPTRQNTAVNGIEQSTKQYASNGNMETLGNAGKPRTRNPLPATRTKNLGPQPT